MLECHAYHHQLHGNVVRMANGASMLGTLEINKVSTGVFLSGRLDGTGRYTGSLCCYWMDNLWATVGVPVYPSTHSQDSASTSRVLGIAMRNWPH